MKSPMFWVRSAQEIEDKWGRDDPLWKEYARKAIETAYAMESKQTRRRKGDGDYDGLTRLIRSCLYDFEVPLEGDE